MSERKMLQFLQSQKKLVGKKPVENVNEGQVTSVYATLEYDHLKRLMIKARGAPDKDIWVRVAIKPEDLKKLAEGHKLDGIECDFSSQ